MEDEKKMSKYDFLTWLLTPVKNLWSFLIDKISVRVYEHDFCC